MKLLYTVLLAFMLAISTAFAQSQRWHFRALLDDKDIGYHTFELQQQGNKRTLQSEARFQVDFLFITAYQYAHNAEERWQGNCLTQLDAKTDDNDTLYAISGQQQNNRFIVQTSSQQQSLPDCVMTFAYWNPAMLEQQRLLNVQTGDYTDVDIQAQGLDVLTIGSQEVAAQRYTLQADDLSIQLWYSRGDQQWLGLETKTEQGYSLRYQFHEDSLANISDTANLASHE